MAWRGDRWSPYVGEVFDMRVRRRRNALAALVGLDDPTEIDAFLGELSDTLRVTWAICRDVNRAASDPQVRKNLKKLLSEGGSLTERVWDTDPNTRGLIEDRAPGGVRALEDLEKEPEKLDMAVRAALAMLEPASRGRPKGTIDHAERYLATNLAKIYRSASTQEPTRRVWPEDHTEYGPFRDFVEVVMEVFPDRVRRYKSSPDFPWTKRVDHIVRLAVTLRADSQRE